MNVEIDRGEVDYSGVVEKEKITDLPRLLLRLRDEFDKEEFHSAALASERIGQILSMDRNIVKTAYLYFQNNAVLDFQRLKLPNGKPSLMLSGNQIYAFGAIIFTVRDSLTEEEKPKINWREIQPTVQKSLIGCGEHELAELIVFSFPERREKPPSYKGIEEVAEEIFDEPAIAEFDFLTDIAPLCTTGVIKNALGNITRDNDSVESNSQEVPAEIAMFVTTIFQSFKERKIMKLRSEDVTNLTTGQFKHMLKWCLLTMELEQNGLSNLLQLDQAIKNYIKQNNPRT